MTVFFHLDSGLYRRFKFKIAWNGFWKVECAKAGIEGSEIILTLQAPDTWNVYIAF
jgi:hypothetical protein